MNPTCPRSKKKQQCGGDCIAVVSADGDTTWGWKCERCEQFLEACQGCKKPFRNLALHLAEAAHPECKPANKVHNTYRRLHSGVPK
jgi:hypothetical protein